MPKPTKHTVSSLRALLQLLELDGYGEWELTIDLLSIKDEGGWFCCLSSDYSLDEANREVDLMLTPRS